MFNAVDGDGGGAQPTSGQFHLYIPQLKYLGIRSGFKCLSEAISKVAVIPKPFYGKHLRAMGL
jgi:hypothetical protein